MPQLNLRSAIPAVTDPESDDPRGGGYHPRLAALRQKAVSGVSAILDAGSREYLYIGESHSGRLFDTLTRHFRTWTPPRGAGEYANSRRQGGMTYDRRDVLVCWVETDDDDAEDLQFDEIERLQPEDNLVGNTDDGELDDDFPV